MNKPEKNETHGYTPNLFPLSSLFSFLSTFSATSESLSSLNRKTTLTLFPLLPETTLKRKQTHLLPESQLSYLFFYSTASRDGQSQNKKKELFPFAN